MGPHIFISHSSKDQKVARTICTALENRGLTCWVYSRNIQPGQNFQEQIVRAIRAAKIMVLVFTANANSSNEIKKELAIASQNNLVVIPVRIEDVIPNEAFAYEFATRQWIDFFDDWESSIARLTELIASTSEHQPSGDQTKASLGSTAEAGAPSVRQPVRSGPASVTGPMSFMQRPLSRWTTICGVGVIVVAAVAYGVLTLRPETNPGAVADGAPTQSRPARATMTATADSPRLDRISDCDRLAAFPDDAQNPQGITGTLIDQIDIVSALTACNVAMRQYPDVARFTFQAGRIAVAQKDYAQARQLFEKAAAAGNASAMNDLGSLYYYGNGVAQDYVTARTWYEKAAAAGNAAAMFGLGLIYQNGNGVARNYAASRTWYEKAAAAGNASAMNGLANIYYNGSGVAQDYATARKWYEKAAAAGNEIAMNNLGNIYYNGNGVSKDYDQARIWYAKAVAAGYASASAMFPQIESSKRK